MEDFQPTCFACDEPLLNPNEPCPKCGYRFDDLEDIYVCPNCKCGLCLITENMCMRGADYFECPEKIKIDDECF